MALVQEAEWRVLTVQVSGRWGHLPGDRALPRPEPVERRKVLEIKSETSQGIGLCANFTFTVEVFDQRTSVV